MDNNNRRDFIKNSGLLLGSLLLSGRAMGSLGADGTFGGLEPMVGEICIFAGNFAPVNWAFCRGQIMSIAEYESLYSLLGTTYGGDGRTSFALPDLSGRLPLGVGRDERGTNYSLGMKSGNPTHTLITNEMPMHVHGAQLVLKEQGGGVANAQSPINNFPAANTQYTNRFSSSYDEVMEEIPLDLQGSVQGGTQPHNNMQPYLGLNFCIALYGIYPSQG